MIFDVEGKNIVFRRFGSRAVYRLPSRLFWRAARKGKFETLTRGIV